MGGLDINARFCKITDIDRARRLERVRDLGIPFKYLRALFPNRKEQELVWITADEVFDAEEIYKDRSRKGNCRVNCRSTRCSSHISHKPKTLRCDERAQDDSMMSE